MDECLARVAQLMEELGIVEDEENAEDLYRTFETININQISNKPVSYYVEDSVIA